MGIFGKVGKWVGDRIGNGPSISGLKSSVKGTGKLAAKVAPYAAFVPGVGPLAAAALAAGGNLAAGKNIGESLMSGAKTYGAGKLLGAVGKIPGVGSLGSKLGNIPGVGAVTNAAHAVGDKLGSIPGVGEIGGFIKDHAGNILDFAKEHPMEIIGGINSAMDAGRARELEGQALNMGLDDWKSREGLRTMGVKGMMDQSVPDLSGVGYDMSGSVYGKKRKIPTVGGLT